MSVQGLGDKTIFQVCVIVDDVERYAKKYSEIFGVEIPKEYHITAGHDETEATYKGTPTEAKAKIVSWQFGRVQFELLQPLGGPSTWQDFLDEHGVGVHHIAFKVEGSDQVAASFGDLGFQVTQQGKFTGLPRGMYTYLDTESALGTTVELLEFFDREKV
jgi:methylmalonyl-CoA/ethylmalonyl-CoA epimerase